MATTKDKVRRLADSLFQKTSENSLQWEVDILNGGVSATVNDNTVNLFEGTNEDGEPVVGIRLLVGMKIVDVFDDDYLGGVKPPRAEYQNYYMYMKEIYNMANRHAVGADKALDEILSDLDNFGF